MANTGCGCSCWALPRSPFALFLCWMAKRISGWGICVSPFAVRVCFCLFLCYDLPTYMTTGVHVDLILTCFFSCKDRASERYRPHREKKIPKKDLALLRKSTTPTYRTLLTRMSVKSTRTLIIAEDRQSTRERTLSG